MNGPLMQNADALRNENRNLTEENQQLRNDLEGYREAEKKEKQKIQLKSLRENARIFFDNAKGILLDVKDTDIIHIFPGVIPNIIERLRKAQNCKEEYDRIIKL